MHRPESDQRQNQAICMSSISGTGIVECSIVWWRCCTIGILGHTVMKCFRWTSILTDNAQFFPIKTWTIDSKKWSEEWSEAKIVDS